MKTSITPDCNHLPVISKSQTLRSLTMATLLAVLTTFAVTTVQAQAIVNEGFDDTLNKHAATTADWNSVASELRLPTIADSPVNSLTGSFPDGTDLSIALDLDNGFETRAVAVGDLDGDGDLDIVFGNSGSNQVYFNNGFGVFTRSASAIPDGAGNTRSAAIADFNGDGHLDIAFAEFGELLASRVHLNNGSGSNPLFTAGEFSDLGAAALKGDSIAAGDVDNDGDIDVVLGIEGGYVKLFRNDGFANFAAAEDIVDTAGTFGFHARTVLLGDLDRDGDLDLVAAREQNFTSIYINNGSGVFSLPEAAGAVENRLPAPDSVGLGDVNGDGFLDMFVGNDSEGTVLGTPAPNYLFLNSGNGPGQPIFPNAPFMFSEGVNTNDVEMIDVDRDGDLDLVTADFIKGNGTNTPGTNHLYLNDGAGNFLATGTDITAVPSVSKTVASGDFDGDGDLDLVFGDEGDRSPPGDDNAPNRIVLNAGIDSGNPANQLFATGLSVTFAPGVDLSKGGFLDPSTSANSDKEVQRVFQYWFSNDGGISWVIAQPNRSFAFRSPGGTTLQWRVELNSRSPALAPNPAIGQLLVRTNGVPSFTSTAVTGVDQDALYEYNIVATDTFGDLLDIRASVLPASGWLTLTDNGDGTALLAGTPLSADVAGPNDVTLDVVDGAGQLDTQTFTIVVNDINDAPTVVAPTGPQSYDQGDDLGGVLPALDTAAAFFDPEGGLTMTYSAAGLPASLTIDSVTGLVTGILTNDDVLAGPDYSVVVTANDNDPVLPLSVDDSFTLTVNNVNDAPTFTSTAVTAASESALYAYSVVTEDIDLDNVTITGGALAWLTLTDNGDGTADLSGTPAGSDVGIPVNVTLTVSDGTLTDDQTFVITVAAATDIPVITLLGNNPVTLMVGTAYTEAGATAIDAQDGVLTAQIVIDSSNVDTDTVGSYTVTYTVSDTAGNMGMKTRTVNVTAVPDTTAPVITLTGGNVTLTVGGTYTDQGATATDDMDGDITANIVTVNPVNPATAGTYTVTYNVMDGAGNPATEVTRTVTVNAATPPPRPPPARSGGGGAFSLPILLLLSGIAIGRRRKKLLDR